MTKHIVILALSMVVALNGAATLRYSEVNNGPTKRFTLVIDPGHGGHDPGAVGRTAKEKDINLATALEFGRLVTSNCPDVEVIYTRNTDRFVTLQGRAQMANQAHADLFVSIHTNALPRGRVARGTETYTLGMARAAANLEVAKRENAVILVESDYQTRYEGFDPNSTESYIIFELIQNQNMAESVAFAGLVQSQFRSAGRNDRGVSQAGFLVLRETTMPSVLIELGYITTADEERFLASRDGQRRMANAIYQAFAAYYRTHSGTSIAPPAQPAATTNQTVTNEEPQAAAETAQQAVSEGEGNTVNQEGNAVEYRVQFASGGRRNLSQYSDLRDVASYNDNGTTKYTAGRFATRREAQRYRNRIVRRYPGAFVVAFHNGVRITMEQAEQLTQ